MPEDGELVLSQEACQACYYFTLASRAGTSKTNESEPAVPLTHLMYLACLDFVNHANSSTVVALQESLSRDEHSGSSDIS